MTVMVLEPGGSPELRKIDGSLESMQAVVGGYIETASFTTSLAVAMNEEGRLLGLPPNKFGMVGTVFFFRPKGEEMCGLTQKQIKILRRLL